MSRSTEQEQRRIRAILGVGLDGDDGHRRVTQGDDFLLLGGSGDTHERMQETMIKLEESLERRGKRLQEAEIPEVIDLLHEAQQ